MKSIEMIIDFVTHRYSVFLYFFILYIDSLTILCTKYFLLSYPYRDNELHFTTPSSNKILGLQYNILWYSQSYHQ